MVRAQRLVAAKGQADASDDVVPFMFLAGRIVDHDAVHEMLRKIAPVVPDLVALIARYCKKPWRHSLILDVAGGMFLREIRGRRLVVSIRRGLDGKIGPTVGRLKSSLS